MECIRNQINKIRNSVEDRQSRKAWQTVNKENKRISTFRAKLKATSLEEQIQKWKESFQEFTRKILQRN